MKKMMLISLLLLSMLMVAVTADTTAYADAIDWTVFKQLKLDAKPLDVATSADSRLIFILVPEKILVYSIAQDKITDEIPVSKDVDTITHFEKTDALIVTGRKSKTLKIIQVDLINKIEISGLPFEGSADAPVTIAVFDDYQ